MQCLRRAAFTFVALVVIPFALNAGEAGRGKNTINHDLVVRLFPAEHRLAAQDTITVPVSYHREFHLLLHRGLRPVSRTPGVIISRDPDQGGTIFESFSMKLPRGLSSFDLEYEGSIYHPIENAGNVQARGISRTPGIVSDKGVYLDGSSFWYPVFDTPLITFNLQVELPAQWDAVSQGELSEHVKDGLKTLVRWKSPEPQEEIYLVAARFIEYVGRSGPVSEMVYLLKPDDEMANKYIEATSRYIAIYSKLIGPYPYEKFALVENFWETGFGMPSFTLLGSTVIRLPFIINSSYPHEILHNWWGNSVFPEYGRGNWSEGLTAYLSDHLMREQQGTAAEYRQTTLQKYSDYVLSGRDFPLTEFRSRHSASSEAIGYGKSLMFFHMLRQELGDRIFTAGLQDFYRKNKFAFASFEDVRQSFERVSEKNLGTEFDQWVSRGGAPKIKLTSIKLKKEGDAYILALVIEQIQTGGAYFLHLPIAVTMEGEPKAWQTAVKVDKKHTVLRFHLPARPTRVDIDPEFDIFRRLDLEETPPAISQALGAKKMLVILPAAADQTLYRSYQEFSRLLQKSGPDEVAVVRDNDIGELPSDRAVAVLGWENRFFDHIISALSGYDLSVSRNVLRIANTELPNKNCSIVLTGRNPKKREMALMFVASGLKEALPGLGRKLPHYHKYSYLVFEGDEPVNISKGRWPVLDSPMTAFIPSADGTAPKAEMGALAPRKPLASMPAAFSRDRMLGTIGYLAKSELAGRGPGTEGLDQAAEYIAEKFREFGLEPAGDVKGSYFQTWEEHMGDPGHNVKMKNVIGVIPGKKEEFAGQSVVIGAHYDHLGLGWPDVRGDNRGKVHPGADDNASGVAVLIELAGELRKKLNPDRSLIFVAFSGEEAGRLGSRRYLTGRQEYPVKKIIGMLNLDTVGRLEKKKLLVLGSGSAREWVHIFRGASFVTGVELETVSRDLDSSDQVSFQTAGVPAVQLFTGPHADYHRPSDTPDKIDAEGLEKVASVAREAIEYLASREEPLTGAEKMDEKANLSAKPQRRVTLGIIPDFAYSGNGCRISGVMPESPAEACGMKDGDVIVMINSEAVKSLKGLTDILKSLQPGSKIIVTFLRDGREMTLETEVTEK